MSEKMMQNDAAEHQTATEISKIDVSDKNGLSKSNVSITLDNGIIWRAQEAFGKDIHNEINHILDKELLSYFPNKPILLYKGRTKIKSDVLVRLKAIADLLQSVQSYPNFRKKVVEAYIRDVLVQPDPRVLRWYTDCISSCIKSSTGKQLSHYHEIDVTPFINAVKAKLD